MVDYICNEAYLLETGHEAQFLLRFERIFLFEAGLKCGNQLEQFLRRRVGRVVRALQEK